MGEIRRRPNGSLDTDYYLGIARRLRNEEIGYRLRLLVQFRWRRGDSIGPTLGDGQM